MTPASSQPAMGDEQPAPTRTPERIRLPVLEHAVAYGVPEMAETQTSSSRGRPRTFDRDLAARTALALVDREGLAALTMRRLARELGTGTMSLYRHFRNKDELLDAVVDLASREGLEHLVLRGDWQARLRTLARALYDGLTRHPGLVQVRLSRPMLSPGALRTTDIAMQVLLDAGFAPRRAAHAYRTLFLYT